METITSRIPARGRKRFQFDLRNASQTVEQGVEVQGLRIFGTPLLEGLLSSWPKIPPICKALFLVMRMVPLIVLLLMRMGS